MSGICGWLGNLENNPQQIIAQMASLLPGQDMPMSRSAQATGFGLAARGMSGTVGLYEQSGYILAMQGHPRWLQDGAGTADIENVCRLFLDAYLKHGAAALLSLNGDFSLALLNSQKRHALLAIDRIGTRNLCYQETAAGLIFGATLDTLRAHPLSRRELDPQALYNYVYFHMLPGPQTAFKSQLRMPAGHYLESNDGHIHLRPYWRMEFVEDRPSSVEGQRDAFLTAVRQATADAAQGAEAVGAFLSGGTDSSTITGMLAKVAPGKPRVYSIGFDATGYDEMEYARIAARHFKAEHHEYYVTPEDVVDAIPRVVSAYDQPFGNASAVPTYYCARLARENGIERLLGGDGGDELYGGNARYATQHKLAFYERSPAALRSLLQWALQVPGMNAIPLAKKARSYVAQASLSMPARYESYNLLERLGPERVFNEDFLAAVDRGAPLALLTQRYEDTNAQTLLNRMLALDLKFTLADNDLPKVTRMCELAGVDVSFPMLDERVVDLSASLAPDFKLRGTRLRYFFKEALRGFLPDEILSKEKHGFGLPVGAWLLGHAPLNDMARDSLARLRQRGIVRSEFIDFLSDRALHEHAAYYGTIVWVLMMMSLWLDSREL